MNILDLKRRLLPRSGYMMPSESDGGNGSTGTSGASAGARGHGGSDGGGDWGAYGGAGWSTQGYTTGSEENRAGDDGGDTSYGEEAPSRAIAEQPGWTSQPSANASPSSNPAAATSSLASTTGEVSPGGLSYAEVRAMRDSGMGEKEGVNPNNPTQTVDQVMASKTFNDDIAPIGIGLLQAAVPGASMAMNAAKRIGAVTSGAQTVGQALGNFAVDTVGNYAAGKINSSLNSATNGLYGQAGMISSAFGLGMPNIGKEVVNGVVSASGIRPGGGIGSIGSTSADNGISGGENRPNLNSPPPTSSAAPTPASPVPATPTTPVPYERVDINMWAGMTPERWAAAAKKLNLSLGD